MQEVSGELEACLSQALPIFLRSLFVKHGVSSYELLISTGNGDFFDLKQIAQDVSQQFDETYRSNIEILLPTIFQTIDTYCFKECINNNSFATIITYLLLLKMCHLFHLCC